MLQSRRQVAEIARNQNIGWVFQIGGAQAILRKSAKWISRLIGQHARATANLDLCGSSHPDLPEPIKIRTYIFVGLPGFGGRLPLAIASLSKRAGARFF